MPVSRCDIIRRNRNNEPPEAVLQGLAMDGLVGVLRQLGDLAELAADVFQDLHDQVMDASARGRRLATRAKQLEAALHPLIDQDFLVYAAAAPNTERLSWHADPKVSHGVVAGGDMPYFIAEYIKQCRGPPGLSILDRYDADGDGACLRRYTNPSFFRANSAKLQQDTIRAQAYLRGKENRPQFRSSENYRPPKSAYTDSSILSFRSEIDTSENASPRFLSMLRQLKHRQTSGSSLSIILKPQLQQNIQKCEPSPVEKASSVDHSEVGISFISSPEIYTEIREIALGSSTTTENQQGNAQLQDPVMPYCSDAGSDYGELGRTSSFEAWLSPDFRTPEHDVIEESCHDTSDLSLRDTMKAKQDSVTEQMSSKAGGSNKRSKYKGSFELIASRVTSFPRKLFIKHHDPSTDYFRNMALEPVQDTGTDSSPASRSEYSIASLNRADIPKQASLPVLEADPVFVTHDSVPEREQCYLHHENTRLQSTRDLSCDASADAEIHHQQNSTSILNQGGGGSAEKCGDASTSADSNNPLWQGKQESMHMINGSPRKSTIVHTESSCSEDAYVDIPPLPPIPPMQWLSVKVHTGPIAHRKSARKDPHKPSEGKVLKTTEFADLTVHSDEPLSEPACTDPQSEARSRDPRRQNFSGGTDHHLQVPDRPPEKLIEDHEKFDCKGTDNSAAHGSTVSTSEASKHGNAAQVDAAQNSPACQCNRGCGGNLQNESVFISAVQELSKMPPPSVPRPKYSLLEVGSHDRNMPFSVKPVHGSSSNVMASPTKSRVTTILQRADDIRQVHADDNDTDSEDGWTDSD